MNGNDKQSVPTVVPLWVYGAVSMLSTAQHGRWLIVGCLLSSLYCLPWPGMLGLSNAPRYLAPDWSWFVVMVLLSAWHIAAVRWMDRNRAWHGPNRVDAAQL